MITFIITTSLDLQPAVQEEVDPSILEIVQEYRIQQYKESVPVVIEFAKSIGARVIVVENNGPRATFFDTMDCEVLYTDSNKYIMRKGLSETLDIWNCLYTFQIPEDELVVKITGRYLLDTKGTFCKELKEYNSDITDCILRYGSFIQPENDEPQEDCLTGLIAMKCKYIKQIQYKDVDVIEYEWAKQSLRLDSSTVRRIQGKAGYRMYSWNTKDITYRDL